MAAAEEEVVAKVAVVVDVVAREIEAKRTLIVAHETRAI